MYSDVDELKPHSGNEEEKKKSLSLHGTYGKSMYYA